MDAKKADEIRQTLLGLISECKDKKVSPQFLVNVIVLEILQKLDQGADEKIVAAWVAVAKNVASKGEIVVEKTTLDTMVGEMKLEENKGDEKNKAFEYVKKVCGWFGI